jgi:hypothetical protein
MIETIPAVQLKPSPFSEYEMNETMKSSNPWITYRTRFLVKAKQLNTSLTFTDVLGRVHSGRKGDYLVESSDGVLRIAPRQIFEDIYVPLLDNYVPLLDNGVSGQLSNPQPVSLSSDTSLGSRVATFPLPTPLTRKSPQPYRDRRSPSVRSL